MKKTIATLTALLLSAIYGFAQTNEKIVVHLRNGEQIEYGISEVDYVEVIANDDSDVTKPTIDTVGGTEADAIDMGGSVLWADHNLGATYSTDAGGYYSWNTQLLQLWSEGWRLPTEEEWLELSDRCTWNWEIRGGIGGRVITAKNGNALFVPAAGLSETDHTLVNGCIGIYWTADVSDNEQPSPLKALGMYFDSANIYRIEYPCDNLFTIRLVKSKQ